MYVYIYVYDANVGQFIFVITPNEGRMSHAIAMIDNYQKEFVGVRVKAKLEQVAWNEEYVTYISCSLLVLHDR